MSSDQVLALKKLILDHVSSPSVRHIRDPIVVHRLAEGFIANFDRRDPLWQKWGEQREQLLRVAARSFVPIGDLTDRLNELGGPKMTRTDVQQRLNALLEESYLSYPNESLRDGCLEFYEAEKSNGTEFTAIVYALRDYVDEEETRLRQEWQDELSRRNEEEKLAARKRLRSGADCKWTALEDGSKSVYARMNGRLFRLTVTEDRFQELERLETFDDSKPDWIGRYRYRRDATKVLKEVAYVD
jgi:hypothetical protein